MNKIIVVTLALCCMSFGEAPKLMSQNFVLEADSLIQKDRITAYPQQVDLMVSNFRGLKLEFTCDLECFAIIPQKEQKYLVILKPGAKSVSIKAKGHELFELSFKEELSAYQRYSVQIESSSVSPHLRFCKPHDAGFGEGRAGGGDGIGDMLGGLLGARSKTNRSFRNTYGRGNIHAPRSREVEIVNKGTDRSKADVMRVIRRKTPSLRHILSNERFRHPELSGEINLEFTIASSGLISDISTEGSTTGLLDFENAILNKVKSWTFEAIESGYTKVSYSYILLKPKRCNYY